MDHLCYLDSKENEYYQLFSGEKTKIARGTRLNKPPFKHVFSGDRIFFVDHKERIILYADVIGVVNSSKWKIKDREILLAEYEKDLATSWNKVKKLIRKNFVVIISLENIKKVDIRDYPKLNSFKRNDWVLAGSIQLPD